MKVRRYAVETEIVAYATNKRDAAVQAMQKLLGGDVDLFTVHITEIDESNAPIMSRKSSKLALKVIAREDGLRVTPLGTTYQHKLENVPAHEVLTDARDRRALAAINREGGAS